MEIPIVVQHRHVHLSPEDEQVLFGGEMEPARPIEHHGQFVARQTLAVHGPSGVFSDVCVLGPVREKTQVELSSSDAFAIGVNAPLRLSGDTERSATVLLKTPRGEVQAKMSTIVPIRHLHLSPQVAQTLHLAHQESVTIQMKGREWIVFDHVVVRVHPTFSPAFHLTKDEAAPAWIQTGDIAIL
ncbi:propanediol utilization protein [Candidatus Uhrbacteria bacterium]|nr:propanediol utilization protein [Candidatus Uhrbacteria bacterium]